MTELMQREMQAVFYMFFAGLAVMLLFSLRDSLLARWAWGKRWSSFLYLFMWMAAAFLFYAFCYEGSYGVIKWYGLVSFAMGILLWKKGICVILKLDVTEYKQGGDEKHETKNKRAFKKIRRKI